MVDSTRLRNHNVAEEYTKVEPLKLHFLPNVPLVQINAYAGDFKGVGNIPESHFVSLFSSSVSFLIMSQHHRNAVPLMLIPV